MKSCILRSHFCLPRQSYLSTSLAKTPHLRFKTTVLSSTKTSTNSIGRKLTEESKTNKPTVVTTTNKSTKHELEPASSNNYSRIAVLGAVSFGVAMLVAGMDDQKALAFWPEGPLMEDFWDNMRRYGLYALTVSTGALYTVFQPLVELLKNPISAILVIVILVGTFYIVTQVVTAMVGVSDFAYEYGY